MCLQKGQYISKFKKLTRLNNRLYGCLYMVGKASISSSSGQLYNLVNYLDFARGGEIVVVCRKFDKLWIVFEENGGRKS